MPYINLVVLLADKDNNFVTINGKTNTFLSTKIDDSLNSAQRVEEVIKLLKDKIDLTINKSRLRLLEESAIDKSLDKYALVYMYKLDDDEKAKLIPLKIITFYYINSLPTLDILSSSVARLITSNYIVYLRRVPNPPRIIFTYPSNVIVYSPIVSAPVLVPFPRRSSPPSIEKIRDAPVVKRVKSEEKKNSPNQRSVNSEVSSALKTESSAKRQTKRKLKKEPKKELSIKSRRESSPRRSSRRRGGEYYEKYIKYKEKYLALKRQLGGANIGDDIQLNDKTFHTIVGEHAEKKHWVLSNGQKILKNMENITWFNNTIQKNNNKIYNKIP